MSRSSRRSRISRRSAARLARVDPDRHTGWGVRVKPVREAMFGWTRERLYTLKAPSSWCCSSRARMSRDYCWRAGSSAAPRSRFAQRSAPAVDESFVNC